MISHGTYPSGSLVLHPEALAAAAREIPPSTPQFKGSHEANWVVACKGEGPVSSDFVYASGLTELTHLGNLAIRLGGRIEWDTATCRATNRPEADALVRMPRRQGWEL
jgi:hypothetical protein